MSGHDAFSMRYRDGDLVTGSGVLLRPVAIRAVLRKLTYWLTYDRDTMSVQLNADHGHGRVQLLRLERVSIEAAASFALELGLEPEGDGAGVTCWKKWNPSYSFLSDGSDRCRRVAAAILSSGIPCSTRVVAGMRPALNDGRIQYSCDTDEQEKEILKKIDADRERYAEQLASTP